VRSQQEAHHEVRLLELVENRGVLVGADPQVPVDREGGHGACGDAWVHRCRCRRSAARQVLEVVGVCREGFRRTSSPVGRAVLSLFF
jgi:hypothetical protein